jgi:hypothetical protein
LTGRQPREPIDYLVLAIGHYQDSGSFMLRTGPLSMIANRPSTSSRLVSTEIDQIDQRRARLAQAN